MTRPPTCDCGTFAVGICVQCQRAVCDLHSKMYGGQRLCLKDYHLAQPPPKREGPFDDEPQLAALVEGWKKQLGSLKAGGICDASFKGVVYALAVFDKAIVVATQTGNDWAADEVIAGEDVRKTVRRGHVVGIQVQTGWRHKNRWFAFPNYEPDIAKRVERAAKYLT